jgi:Holliday junction resolvasome RuvABC endonuclease subunit
VSRDPFKHCAPGGLLGLDLSSTCGWAYLADLGQRTPDVGSWRLPSLGGQGAKFAALENELAAALNCLTPIRVVVEAPLPPVALSNATTVRLLYGLNAIVRSECWRASISLIEIDSHTARLEIIGPVRAKPGEVKQLVMAWCAKRGIAAPDDHAADAAVVALWCARRLSADSGDLRPILGAEAAPSPR